MIRIVNLVRPCCVALALLTFGNAQEAATTNASGDIGQLRQAVEKQTNLIEDLSKQVSELSRKLEEKEKGTGKPAGEQTQTVAPKVAIEPAEKPSPPPPQTTAPQKPAPVSTTPPAAENVAGVKHTVAKGETLTSIAKHYNIPLAELEKANTIQNDRMLQIGQVLTIPSTTNKTPEPQKEQKENP